MRTVTVPLDGSVWAESVIPDAVRLAGPEGKLVLVHEASLIPFYGIGFMEDQTRAIEASRAYLDSVADRLRDAGTRVETRTTLCSNAVGAVLEVAAGVHADMLAVATHGRGTVGRLMFGSIARRVLAGSDVPVLLRHVDGRPDCGPRPSCILVPLDGSAMAESAVPLAAHLAREWNAELRLTTVIPAPGRAGNPLGIGAHSETSPAACDAAQAYLRAVATGAGCDVRKTVLMGPVTEALVAAVHAWSVSHVVMASHGRTGLSRAIVGGVTDALVHNLSIPILVVPARASVRAGKQVEDGERHKTLAASAV